MLTLGIKNQDRILLDFSKCKIKNLEAKTDKSTTFSDLGDCIDVHVREISGTEEGKFNLKWVHIAIRNLKKHLQTYHMISERMMQNTLDGFCYWSSTEDASVKGPLTGILLLQFILTGQIVDKHIKIKFQIQ